MKIQRRWQTLLTVYLQRWGRNPGGIWTPPPLLYTVSKKSYIFLVPEISKRESGSESTKNVNIIVKYNDSIPIINMTILFLE